MPERFLKIPHIRQKSNADCLVACAAMMLESAGFRADYNHILRLLGTSELGTPHSRIQLLSRIHSDLLLIYREGELEDIIRFLDNGYPIGIFVYTKELPYWTTAAGHAVVVVGYTEQVFYLHDPAFNDTPQAVTYGDLQLAWEAYDSFLAVVQRKHKPQ